MITQKIKKWIKSNIVIRKLYIIRSLCMDSNISYKDYFKAKNKNYVFMTATHNNAGDIAQSVCIKKWLDNNYESYTTINVGLLAPDDAESLRDICRKVKKNDNVFIHSGFNITDVGSEYGAETVFPSHKIILEELKDHKIVFFPQSVQFRSIDKWKNVKNMYMQHPNIIFISRDMKSQQYAKELLPYAKHLCYPDIVTTWIGKYKFNKPDKGILFCVRADKESIINETVREKIINDLNKIMKVDISDTNLEYAPQYVRAHREKVVMEMIERFSHYKVIVTDRYHGTIFSLIAGRPVVVLKTSGHKVSEGLNWFPVEIKNYVGFIENVENCQLICDKVLEFKDINMLPLPKYFCEHYYDKLFDEIN